MARGGTFEGASVPLLARSSFTLPHGLVSSTATAAPRLPTPFPTGHPSRGGRTVRRGAVPLSDHEQRLLEQIERALYAEDPKFASTVSSTDLRTHARRRGRRVGPGHRPPQAAEVAAAAADGRAIPPPLRRTLTGRQSGPAARPRLR